MSHQFTTLRMLRDGALFETRDGIRAVKSEYHTFDRCTQCDCYLLESGEAAHFRDGDLEMVREIDLGQLLSVTTEVARLRTFIAQCLPFLQEAWDACFRGQKERLLSAEERGMGRLLDLFKDVADGKPALPPGVVTVEECESRNANERDYYQRMVGIPNELPEHLSQWIEPGETCVHGIQRATEEVARLTAHNLMLVKALEPFEHQARIIEEADALENVKPETFELFRFRGSYTAICYGDCVRARQAMAGKL